MARIGYIRVSSTDQNTERQLAEVKDLDKVFTDKASGKDTDRPQLQAMLDYVREGDTIIIHSIDRLARSLADLLGLVKQLNSKGISIVFYKERLEFTGKNDDPMQKLMLSMMGSFAEFERSMIRERQREGIAKAKEAGVYKGRKKTVDDAAIRAAIEGGLSYRKAAEQLGISLSTVQRAMKAA